MTTTTRRMDRLGNTRVRRKINYPERRKAPAARDGSWHDDFLTELSKHGNIKYACAAVGVNYKTFWNHKQKDEDFAVDCAEAIEFAVASLEVEVDDRARDKYNDRGRLVRPGSDRLAIERLRALKPWVYRENWKPSSELDDGQIQLLVEALNAAAEALRLTPGEHRLMVEAAVKVLRRNEEKVAG